jgi:hypothetical protein
MIDSVLTASVAVLKVYPSSLPHQMTKGLWDQKRKTKMQSSLTGKNVMKVGNISKE